MDIQEQNGLSCGEDIVELTDIDEEISSPSAEDAAFDAVIGCICDIIKEEEFYQLEKSFMEKYYLVFEDSDENKLIYTDIFNEYVDLLEKHLEQQLMERIPGFNMDTFIELVMQHKESVPEDILNMLLTFTDFMAFKEMFLEYRTGRNLDVSKGLVIISLMPADSSSTELQ